VVADFICNDALSPLRRTGASLRFYPVTEALEANLEVCRSMLGLETPDIVVVVHYFGRLRRTSMRSATCARVVARGLSKMRLMCYALWTASGAAEILCFSVRISCSRCRTVRCWSCAPKVRLSSAPQPYLDPGSRDVARATADLHRQLDASTSKRPHGAVWWIGKRLLQRAGFRRLGDGSASLAKQSQAIPHRYRCFRLTRFSLCAQPRGRVAP